MGSKKCDGILLVSHIVKTFAYANSVSSPRNDYTNPIITLAVVLSAVSLTLGLPQITGTNPETPTVFTPWSSHPDCAAAIACKADCTKAVDSLCRKGLVADNILKTAGECTAWYLYRTGNTIPKFDQSYSAFAYINDPGNRALMAAMGLSVAPWAGIKRETGPTVRRSPSLQSLGVTTASKRLGI